MKTTSDHATSTPSPDRPLVGLPSPSGLSRHWSLDPGVVFLNHGSFGATPLAVQAAQNEYRARLEREPVKFFIEDHMGLMDTVRQSLGRFIHCPPQHLAPLPNASIAVATVFENLKLSPGDEVLMNEHEYPACQNTVRRAAARSGAKVVTIALPFPCPTPDAVVEAVLRAVTAKTKLALLSHVTSPTGLVMPVEPIVAELNRRGVQTLVDGAHAPGMIPGLDLSRLAPTYYTANCHKWICSPKGSAFLYVHPDHQPGFRPLALSNHAEKGKPGRSQFLTEFDFVGTQDYTSIYAIPDAIDFMGGVLPGGWPQVQAANHDLCTRGRNHLCRVLGMQPPAPDSMIGSICTMILPPHDEARRARLAARPTKYHDALQDTLIERHRIQVPVWGLAGKPDRFLRISSQVYNTIEQYEYLAEAVKGELARERDL